MELKKHESILKIVLIFHITVVTVLFLFVQQAQASKSSGGKLLFFPCDKCHPPGKDLPNGFQGHKVKLEHHDKLGEGKSACFACHQSVDNPALLKLADGSFVPIDGEISRVCYGCHSDKYKEWKEGAHGESPLKIDGKYGENTKCTVKACHDPHTPGWIGITPILPYLGTTIEVEVMSEKKSFTALPQPASAPPVKTPSWLKILTLLGITLAGGLIGAPLVIERLQR